MIQRDWLLQRLEAVTKCRLKVDHTYPNLGLLSGSYNIHRTKNIAGDIFHASCPDPCTLRCRMNDDFRGADAESVIDDFSVRDRALNKIQIRVRRQVISDVRLRNCRSPSLDCPGPGADRKGETPQNHRRHP